MIFTAAAAGKFWLPPAFSSYRFYRERIGVWCNDFYRHRRRYIDITAGATFLPRLPRNNRSELFWILPSPPPVNSYYRRLSLFTAFTAK